MTANRADRVLILGGAGMVGVQVAREIARELRPSEIIISALTQREVDEAIESLEADARTQNWACRFSAAPGDIFIPHDLQGKTRRQLLREKESFDRLFDDIFSPASDSYKDSSLYRLLMDTRPDVVVDCINTATAISYQDVFTTSRRVKHLMDAIEGDEAAAIKSLPDLIQSVRELLVAQGIPQITRHILFLQRALDDASVNVYVKVGTTGTGGMGINIPYTHSEDKPSPTLLSKSAIGFAHTGLLFLLARTPGRVTDGDRSQGTMIKEVKPGAMIGFKRLGMTHVRLTGENGGREPGFLLESATAKLGSSIQPRARFEDFRKFDARDVPVEIVGADTGENGFFSIGEFQAITYPRQMEYVTPEEVARTVVLEIVGASTGRDVLAAIDGAITEPSYRAGVLRDHAIREMERLERALQSSPDALPSIAVGHLGPPRLSKLLIEAWLIRAATSTDVFNELRAFSSDDLMKRVEIYLEKNRQVESLITTIGIPILRQSDDGMTLTRGPRINIPVSRPDDSPLPLGEEMIERYSFLGWADLRLCNFEAWRERLDRLAGSRASIATGGSAAFDGTRYLPETFSPGDVVGWLLTNEIDDQGMVGHRLF